METQAFSPKARPGSDLLTADFMRQLDRLDVLSRKILRGRMQGERRSKKRGQSVEFADYRNYVMGDDLRRIDWNLYARLDKLFLRLFMEEEDMSVSIALDITGSMDHGSPNKLRYGKKLAAALGYIALSHFNRLNMYCFTDQIVDAMESMRGKRPIPQMLNFLDRQRPQATADGTHRSPGNLTPVCKTLALRHRQPGVVILISDLLDKGEMRESLRYLTSNRLDVYILQVLSPDETDPTRGQIIGDLRLVDVEDGDVAEVSIGQAILKKYQANIQGFCQFIRDQCVGRGMTHMVTETNVPLDTVVLNYMRQRGLIG